MSTVPTRDDRETETLDADITPTDMVDILSRLKFHNGKACDFISL